jgi:hypothetical protein
VNPAQNWVGINAALGIHTEITRNVDRFKSPARAVIFLVAESAPKYEDFPILSHLNRRMDVLFLAFGGH